MSKGIVSRKVACIAAFIKTMVRRNHLFHGKEIYDFSEVITYSGTSFSETNKMLFEYVFGTVFVMNPSQPCTIRKEYKQQYDGDFHVTPLDEQQSKTHRSSHCGSCS